MQPVTHWSASSARSPMHPDSPNLPRHQNVILAQRRKRERILLLLMKPNVMQRRRRAARLVGQAKTVMSAHQDLVGRCARRCQLLGMVRMMGAWRAGQEMTATNVLPDTRVTTVPLLSRLQTLRTVQRLTLAQRL